MLVTALKSFDHNGKVKRGDSFPCSDHTANALKRAGLVSFDEETPINPILTACIQSSALPVVQVSPQTIANLSDNGGTLKLKKKPGRKKKP